MIEDAPTSQGRPVVPAWLEAAIEDAGGISGKGVSAITIMVTLEDDTGLLMCFEAVDRETLVRWHEKVRRIQTRTLQ